jgi:hypothetical protein
MVEIWNSESADTEKICCRPISPPTPPADEFPWIHPFPTQIQNFVGYLVEYF